MRAAGRRPSSIPSFLSPPSFLGISQSEEVWREQGRLGHAVLVKMRIRHFTEGAAFGSRAFLEEVFQKRREKFGPTRKDDARPILDVRWGELMSMRNLRKVEG